MERTIFDGKMPSGWNTMYLDFETFYDSKYSLRKLTTEEYVRDERFQALCAVAILNNDEEAIALKASELKDFFDRQDWSKTVLVAHNAAFDAFILGEVFGHHPARVVCTMALARSLYPNFDGGYSLRNLGDRLVRTETPKGYLEGFQGFTLADYEADDELYTRFLQYCARDTFVLRELYQALVASKRLDKVEMSAACGMLRATIDPVLKLDEDIVESYAAEREAELEANKHLAKDEVFADALREHGIEPDVKMGAKRELYAFAKSDWFMQDLMESGTDEVKALVEGRLMAKSTSERTKARRFADIAKRGLLPVSVMPNAAHTGRDGGGGAINLQNVKRGSPLRRAVMAQRGDALIVADSSQIECRVLNWMAGQQWVMDAFSEGQDIYCVSGAKLFGRPISKDGTPGLRQHAKIVELGSGYGLGALGLQKQMKQAGVSKDEDECQELIHGYRDSHQDVVQFWKRLDKALERMTTAPARWLDFELGEFFVHVGKERLRLPSGRHLVYPNLRFEETDRGTGYVFGKLVRTKLVDKRVYGGAFCENVVQAVARDIIFEADVRIRQRLEGEGLRLALRVHDELVYTCPSSQAHAMLDVVVAEMNRCPEWWPEDNRIVLATEASVAERWGDAK